LLDAHESLGDNVTTIDEDTTEFVKELMDGDTSIVIYSDHG